MVEKHLIVSDEVHTAVIKKQAELILKGINKTMSEIANIAIMSGLDQVK